MKKILLYFLVLGLSFQVAISQTDTAFNQVDTKGLKQGYWKKYYPNGKLMYRGQFKDNNPIGEMHRYYESGGLQAFILFNNDGESAKAKLFYEDGKLSAEGNYYQMQKDSLWKYYSYYTSALVSDEFYVKGKKNGIHRSYYENGQVSEETEWLNDYKEGKWIQYFPDGSIKMKTNYSFNMVNGRYYFYYTNHIIMILGNFVDNKRHGPWAFYDENGKEKYIIEYEYGRALNDDKILESDEDYFKAIEENIGKFEEPSLEDFFPGGGGFQ
jgi:antitoxin component YwqK of YwqJK toxin-antitoxin module